MLTFAPLPRVRDVAAALLSRPAPVESIARGWASADDVAGLLSRSAWSMALVAQWRQREQNGRAPTVWIPAYFCNEALEPLRAMGARLCFYPLKPDSSPDVEGCRELLQACRPDLVLVVHYFGRPCDSPEEMIDLTSGADAWIIEDAAHALRPASGVGSIGDFVIYSPHKHLPVPDGAVLVVRRSGPSALSAERIAMLGQPASWPGQLEALSDTLRVGGRVQSLRQGVWLAKRLIQRSGFWGLRRSTEAYQESESSQSAGSAPIAAPHVSWIGHRLLSQQYGKLLVVERLRQTNVMLWDTVIAESNAAGEQRLVPCERPVRGEWVPYLAGYGAQHEAAESVFSAHTRAGWPISTWPDLPPEVRSRRLWHTAAWSLRHSRVFLPVHQSLTIHDILSLRRRPSSRPRFSSRCELDWDPLTEGQWGAWIREAGRSSLMQGWSYGTAKEFEESWRVERGVFRLDGKAIAIVQVLKRRVAGGGTIVRVNRGPLELRPLDAEERRSTWRLLADLASMRGRRLLLVAPELVQAGENLAMLYDLGFRRRSAPAVSSAWLDLRSELPELRSALRGSWRSLARDLDRPERKGIKIDVTGSPEALEWLMARYADLMVAREFGGAPINLIRTLQRIGGGRDRVVVLRATRDNEPIAGVCVATHGAAATYLVGWSGASGRKVSATQFLLWAAVGYLRDEGFEWFDLGGIDEARTPGIAAFKVGMGGARYDLVGEYWRLY